MIADSLPSLEALATGLNLADLISCDNPTNDRALPVIIAGDQKRQYGRAAPTVGISQCIGNITMEVHRAQGLSREIITPLWVEGLEQ